MPVKNCGKSLRPGRRGGAFLRDILRGKRLGERKGGGRFGKIREMLFLCHGRQHFFVIPAGRGEGRAVSAG
jgi:hypothetical protein